MYSDTHIHSKYSADSKTELEDIIKQAISLKMKHICITDHQDFDYPKEDLKFDLDVYAYYDELTQLRNKYSGNLDILIGVETGLELYLSDKISTFTKSVPFDFIIGSSHLVNRKDPFYPEHFANRTDKECFEEYFLSIIEIIKAYKDFDVYGHLDYIVRYSPNKNKNYSYSAFSDYLDEILKSLIYMGKGIEINTGGFRYGLESPNPSKDIIKRYKELGGEIITIASDAHTPEYLGYNFDRAASILSICGFKYYNVFKQRKPIFLALNES